MEKIPKASSWNLKPTPKQVRAITQLCQQLHIAEALEETPANRWEARRLIMGLRKRRKEEINGEKGIS